MLLFLKQEKPEMNDFERKGNFGSKGKYLGKISIFNENILWNVSTFLMDTLANISQKFFVYSFVSEHSKHFFYLRQKKLAFLTAKNPLRMHFITCSLMPSVHW